MKSLFELTPYSLARRSLSPWREWDRMLDNPNAYLEKSLGQFSFAPACDLTEDAKSYFLKVDLPGMKREEIKVDVTDNHITVSGERKVEKREDDKKDHITETAYGSFTRSFTFPVAVDPERTEAKFENGVLMVALPKTIQGRGRQVSVK